MDVCDFDDDHDVGSSHERVDDPSPSASSSPLPTQRMGPHCISLAPSTAFALTIVAKNLERTGRLHPGGTVLVLDDQMSSACIPSRPRGCTLEAVPRPRNDLSEGGTNVRRRTWTDDGRRKFVGCGEEGDRRPSKVVAVCVPQCHWSDSTLLDLVRISRACRGGRDVMIANDNDEDVALVIGLRVFWNHGRVRFEIAQFRGCE
jgi:hypothetical protein